MALLDRLRRRPRWEDPDPKVRADAVREIPAEEQDRLAQMAAEDPDPLVRRAALRRVSDAAVLARIATTDEDTAVREKAASALVALAVGSDEAAAQTAAAALSEPRHLMNVVLTAALPGVRVGAVSRLQDTHSLARIARTSTDPAARQQAVAALADAAVLAEVAARSEHKDAAVAAVERLDDPESLRAVAAKARNKSASRRAREKLAVLLPAASIAVPPSAPAPAPDDVAEPPAADDVAEPPVADEADAPTTLPGAEDEDPVESLAGSGSPEDGSEDAPIPEAAAEEGSSEEDAGRESEDVAGASADVPSGETPVTDAAAHASPTASDTASLAPRLRADRKERVAKAEALCARLTALVGTTPFSLRDAEVALREARLPHDDLAVLPPKLARHLREARAALFARAQEAREAEEWQRWGNAAAQEELCRRLEALVAETDLEKAARELRTLDARWAEVKIAPRDEASSLRQRYQAARAPLKERLDAYFAEKGAREGENLRLKQELSARAEALAESTDWIKASEELKTLQARWKEIGPAPRKAADAVWKRFRAACDRFFSRRQDDLKKRKQEWSANMAKKQALTERAEQLATSTDWEAAASEVRKLQAEWKTVGPVRRDRSEAIWQRFRKACDAFFERYKHRDEAERQARLEQREAVYRELEALVAGAGTEPAPPGIAEQIQRVTARARQGTPVGPAEEEAFAARAAAVRDRALAAWPEAFRGTDLDPEAARARREKLCTRVESLLAQGEPPVAALSGQDLARRLKEALATNTMGGRGEVEAKRRAEADEVKAAQATWRRLPPLPGPEGQALESRFRSACDRFFRDRPPATTTSRAR
jgi:uncharacterized protein DUF349